MYVCAIRLIRLIAIFVFSIEISRRRKILSLTVAARHYWETSIYLVSRFDAFFPDHIYNNSIIVYEVGLRVDPTTCSPVFLDPIFLLLFVPIWICFLPMFFVGGRPLYRNQSRCLGHKKSVFREEPDLYRAVVKSVLSTGRSGAMQILNQYNDFLSQTYIIISWIQDHAPECIARKRRTDDALGVGESTSTATIP